MTIETIIKCDASNCSAMIEPDADMNIEGEIVEAGWHFDPEYSHWHYCPSCWPEVKKEREEQSNAN